MLETHAEKQGKYGRSPRIPTRQKLVVIGNGMHGRGDPCAVVGAGGIVAPYDQLLIATGSRPYIPLIEGLHTTELDYKPGVLVFRSLEQLGINVHVGKDTTRVLGDEQASNLFFDPVAGKVRLCGFGKI